MLVCATVFCATSSSTRCALHFICLQSSTWQFLSFNKSRGSFSSTRKTDWREGQNLRSLNPLPLTLYPSPFRCSLVSPFPSTDFPFHLKQYLESKSSRSSSSSTDEMCSFVRVRQQCMACGFDRLDTSKQTGATLQGWLWRRPESVREKARQCN